MKEVRRHESEQGRFTLIFLAASRTKRGAADTKAPLVELTYNWDPENYTGGRNFGHLAYEVDNIYETCQRLMDKGVTINRPPRDGNMAFVKSPDNISIELLQKGPALPTGRTLGVDAQHRQLVGRPSPVSLAIAMRASTVRQLRAVEATRRSGR